MKKMNLFKKVIVTLKNYEEIMEQIKKSTDHYYMIERYSCCSDKDDWKSECIQSMIQIRSYAVPFVDADGDRNYKRKHKLFVNEQAIGVKKHRILTDYESGNNNNPFENWLSMKPVIGLNTGIDKSLIINVGDQIRFLPFGGFIIYTDNWYTYSSHSSYSVYKHAFFPNKFHKIFDIEQLMIDRAEEEERLEEEFYQSEREREYYEDYEDDDECY